VSPRTVHDTVLRCSSVAAVLRLAGRGELDRDVVGRTIACPLDAARPEMLRVSRSGCEWSCLSCGRQGDALDLGVLLGIGRDRAAVFEAVGAIVVIARSAARVHIAAISRPVVVIVERSIDVFLLSVSKLLAIALCGAIKRSWLPDERIQKC